jgi:hypothetical protein
MGLFKIFGKEMLRLLHTYSMPSHYLMNWLLLADPSLLKTSTSIYFVAFVVSLKTWKLISRPRQNRCHMWTFTTISLLMSFYISLFFPPWLQIHLYCPHHLCCPLLILLSSRPAPILAVIEFVPAAAGVLTTTMIGLIFVALIPLLPRNGKRVIGSSLNGLLLGDSGLLTDLLSSTSSVSYAFPSVTQPCNVLSFAALVTSPLPILLLVRFLPLHGSWTPVRTNMLRLILRL